MDEINLELTNLTDFESLLVDFDIAKAFISNRKDRYGNVARDVYSWVSLLLTEELKFEREDLTLKVVVHKKTELYHNHRRFHISICLDII